MVAGALEETRRPYRILIAKPGLDGHDRGAKVIVRALRDAGFEVIYTGIRQTPEMIAQTAMQEDVDAIGLSLLSGAHMTLFPQVTQLLKARGLERVLVFGGGIIPDEDVAKLKKKGVDRVFGPGTPLSTIVDYLNASIGSKAATSKPKKATRSKAR
ncbi:MAG: cobalamin B12-binding domain-containing protein [Elusimicrobia bacterium]|nr:cobalamin B12-binding domain-containing protein [Elusimicrobiota bacterium]